MPLTAPPEPLWSADAKEPHPSQIRQYANTSQSRDSLARCRLRRPVNPAFAVPQCGQLRSMSIVSASQKLSPVWFRSVSCRGPPRGCTPGIVAQLRPDAPDCGRVVADGEDTHRDAGSGTSAQRGRQPGWSSAAGDLPVFERPRKPRLRRLDQNPICVATCMPPTVGVAERLRAAAGAFGHNATIAAPPMTRAAPPYFKAALRSL